MKYEPLIWFGVVIITYTLTGCNQPGTKPPTPIDMVGDTTGEGYKSVENAAKPPLPAEYTPGQPILFIDSFVFDSDLSAILRNDVAKIEVETDFSINSIPGRMDHWLSEIKNSGGKVQAKQIVNPDKKSRGFLDVIDLIFALVTRAKDAIIYAPVKSYNAMLYYDVTHIVRKVVFERRSN